MRKLVGLLIFALTAFASLGAWAEKSKVTGWVSDENCGVTHTKPGREDCVTKCRRGGASIGHPEWKPQRMVLVVEPENDLLFVDNPEALSGQDGKHVQVSGDVDAKKKSIHVENFSAIPSD